MRGSGLRLNADRGPRWLFADRDATSWLHSPVPGVLARAWQWVLSPSQGQTFWNIPSCVHSASSPKPVMFKETGPGDGVGPIKMLLRHLRSDSSNAENSSMSSDTDMAGSPGPPALGLGMGVGGAFLSTFGKQSPASSHSSIALCSIGLCSIATSKDLVLTGLLSQAQVPGLNGGTLPLVVLCEVSSPKLR